MPVKGNEDTLLQKYKEILAANGIHDKVVEVTVKDSGAKGDGLASLTQCVTVSFENPEKPPLNLFIKTITENPSHNAMLEEWKAFEKETRFYMEYLPAAKKMCELRGLNDLVDLKIPKCYYGDDNLIVLENLVIEKGFELHPRDIRHGFDTAAFVLKMLAKLHALSYAMIQESGGEESFLQRFPNLDHYALGQPCLIKMAVDFGVNAIKINTLVIEESNVENKDVILAKLNCFKDASTIKKIWKKTNNYDKVVERFLVLNHGDYKNNNMMFLTKKETNTILQEVMVDFQLTCYNSPALDLTFYMFTTVDSKVRQSRLKELLSIYLDTLNQVSNQLGHPTELSYEDLLMQYRRKIDYGFMMGSSTVGPGMGLFKTAGIDVSKINMDDLPKIFRNCLLKWIDENPDKGREMVEEIKILVEEHSALKLK